MNGVHEVLLEAAARMAAKEQLRKEAQFGLGQKLSGLVARMPKPSGKLWWLPVGALATYGGFSLAGDVKGAIRKSIYRRIMEQIREFARQHPYAVGALGGGLGVLLLSALMRD